MEIFADQLNQLLEGAGLSGLVREQSAKFESYLQLILKWNPKINLTAVREEDILARHFVESIACALNLPGEIATLLDFGSGAGLPGIPVAICRPALTVTLAESQGKKAAFLAEAVRQLRINAKVFAARAETLQERFDCVTLRAVDRMELAVAQAAHLVVIEGLLAVMTTLPAMAGIRRAAGHGFTWSEPQALPGSERRVLLIARRMGE